MHARQTEGDYRGFYVQRAKIGAHRREEGVVQQWFCTNCLKHRVLQNTCIVENMYVYISYRCKQVKGIFLEGWRRRTKQQSQECKIVQVNEGSID